MVKYANHLICIICVFVNINKNVKNKGKSLNYKLADFISILSLLRVLYNQLRVLQYNKSIYHPVVLYEHYFICILKCTKKEIKRGKPCKNYKPEGGDEVVGYLIYLVLLGHFIYMPNCYVGPPDCEKKCYKKS